MKLLKKHKERNYNNICKCLVSYDTYNIKGSTTVYPLKYYLIGLGIVAGIAIIYTNPGDVTGVLKTIQEATLALKRAAELSKVKAPDIKLQSTPVITEAPKPMVEADVNNKGSIFTNAFSQSKKGSIFYRIFNI